MENLSAQTNIQPPATTAIPATINHNGDFTLKSEWILIGLVALTVIAQLYQIKNAKLAIKELKKKQNQTDSFIGEFQHNLKLMSGRNYRAIPR